MSAINIPEDTRRFYDYLKANGVRDVQVIVAHRLESGLVRIDGIGDRDSAKELLLRLVADDLGLKVEPK